MSGIMQRVLLIGSDDDARRALHVLLDRRGLTVAAAADLASALRHVASDGCDVVLAAAELAAVVAREAGVPPVIAVVRTRELAVSTSLL
ncbi:MAG: hypothetical protein ACM31C_20560, partial [Acidobacteriota bacterium]